MEKFKIDDEVLITENTKISLGLANDAKYKVVDILQDGVDFRILLKSDENGKDWFQFFKEEELITIETK
jgi:hypothetical protein